MSPPRSAAGNLEPLLERHEGHELLSAWQAILKGILESDTEVALVVGPVDEFGRRALPEADQRATTAADLIAIDDPLRRSGVRVQSVSSANRALTLAARAARSNKSAVVLVPNDQVEQIVAPLAETRNATFDRAALLLIMQDSPSLCSASSPRQLIQRLEIPCLEPSDVRQLRDAIDDGLRISRVARGPAAIIVHDSILHAADTIEVRPNRVAGSVDAMLARRKKGGHSRARWSESTSVSGSVGVLRVGRRLEFNRFRALPNPGERVAVGFITVGPADVAVQHITNALGLLGRVPVLHLAMLHPLDEVAVARMLTRCQQVVVIEPRPGEIESAVMAIAERMRRQPEKDGQPATVWGRDIPAISTGKDQPFAQIAVATDDPIHPSILVRRIAHLLHSLRPAAQITSQLSQPTVIAEGSHTPASPFADDSANHSISALAEMRRILNDVDQALRESPEPRDDDAIRAVLAIDGAPVATTDAQVVNVEVWSHARFVQDGLAAMVQTAREVRRADAPSSWMFVVCESTGHEIRDLERLARGAVPADLAYRIMIEVANLRDRRELRNTLRELVLRTASTPRLSVLVVQDGPPAQFDPVAIEHSFVEIDRLGFEPRQRLIRPADEVCALRPRGQELDEPSAVLADTASELTTSWTVTQIRRPGMPAFRAQVRPLLEEVEVIRVRPPLLPERLAQARRCPTPQPVHANAGWWRAHLAGIRRDPPGLATTVLAEAGRQMGYHVRWLYHDAPIGFGYRAWAQVLFTRPYSGSVAPALSTMIPYGEADVVLGLDQHEIVRAMGVDPRLCVTSPRHTFVVANVMPSSSHEFEDLAIEAIHASTRADSRLLNDFSGACRARFHTDRIADMALVGAAYQLGLIPVSLEAIEGAVMLVQARGHGRCREAFDFGRRLAVEPELFRQMQREHEEDVSRLTRRLTLSLSRGAWGGGTRARDFGSLIQHALDTMPGLAETQSGRLARQDFVMACHRCRIWGGFSYARQYADLVVKLYHSDRGDTGRQLTRAAILPLAETMLIRDPLYIAGMATSAEQRRSLRRQLNVKVARGDRIERRYLVRLEAITLGRRFRADVRTSDWPARAISLLRRLVPNRIRGTRRQRDLRQYVMNLVKRAASRTPAEYDAYLGALQRLHDYAAEHRLRGMALAEVRMLVEAGFSDSQRRDELAHVPAPEIASMPPRS